MTFFVGLDWAATTWLGTVTWAIIQYRSVYTDAAMTSRARPRCRRGTIRTNPASSLAETHALAL